MSDNPAIELADKYAGLSGRLRALVNMLLRNIDDDHAIKRTVEFVKKELKEIDNE